MTVKELIAELKKFPEDYEVLQSRDEEGNGFFKVEQAADLDDMQKFVVFWPGDEVFGI